MFNIRRAPLGLAVLLLLLGAGTVLAGSSEHYAIEWQVFGGGGPMSSPSGNIAMTGTLGQLAVSKASSPSYEVGSGYEGGVVFIPNENPTAITLVSFTAQAKGDGVILAWETGTEIDNAGFSLYRATDAAGPYLKINDVLIPAEGDPVTGASYSYLDTAALGETIYYYQLEDIDFFGVSTIHGPVNTATGLTGGPSRENTYLPLIIKPDSGTD